MDKLPKIWGTRKLKSVFALLFSFALWQIIRLIIPIDLDIHPLFAYIYAVIEIRQTSNKTEEFGLLRIKATLVGLSVGLLILPLSVYLGGLLNYNTISIFVDLTLIAIGVFFSLWLAQVFKCKMFCGIAAIIFIICIVRDRNSDVNIYLYAILRIVQTLLGVFSAWIVNKYILMNPKEKK